MPLLRLDRKQWLTFLGLTQRVYYELVKLAKITNLLIRSLDCLLLVLLLLLLLGNHMSVELYAGIRVGKLSSIFVLVDNLVRWNDVVVCIVDFQPNLRRLRVTRKVHRHLIQKVFDLFLQVRLNMSVIHEFLPCFAKFDMFVDKRSHRSKRDGFERETFFSYFEEKAVLLLWLGLDQTSVSGATRL